MQCREHCLHFRLNDKEKPLELQWKKWYTRIKRHAHLWPKIFDALLFEKQRSIILLTIVLQGMERWGEYQQAGYFFIVGNRLYCEHTCQDRGSLWGWRGGARMSLTSKRGREIIAAGSDWYKSVQCRPTSDISLPTFVVLFFIP